MSVQKLSKDGSSDIHAARIFWRVTFCQSIGRNVSCSSDMNSGNVSACKRAQLFLMYTVMREFWRPPLTLETFLSSRIGSLTLAKKSLQVFAQSSSMLGVVIPSDKTRATLLPGWHATVAVDMEDIVIFRGNGCGMNLSRELPVEVSDRRTGDEGLETRFNFQVGFSKESSEEGRDWEQNCEGTGDKGWDGSEAGGKDSGQLRAGFMSGGSRVKPCWTTIFLVARRLSSVKEPSCNRTICNEVEYMCVITANTTRQDRNRIRTRGYVLPKHSRLDSNGSTASSAWI